MENSQSQNSGRLSWLGSVTSLLAVLTCYGTLAAATLLSVLGVSVDLNEGILVKLISVLLVIALLGMAYSYRLHKNPAPLAVSVAAAAALLWAFYGTYHQALEAAGFIGLVGASILDFRAKRRACAK